MTDKTAILAVEIRRENLESPVATTLIQALNAELSARYPEEGATHFQLDAAEVAEGHGAFLVAYDGDQPVGCGAIRRLKDGGGELKRMYVVPEYRSRGVGRSLLAALEAEGRRLGVTRILLETGVRQSAAQALYTRAGFEKIAAYGEYIHSPLSLCMAKRL